MDRDPAVAERLIHLSLSGKELQELALSRGCCSDVEWDLVRKSVLRRSRLDTVEGFRTWLRRYPVLGYYYHVKRWNALVFDEESGGEDS
jgi:hypothetical protein